jgi:iron(III) transport system ATP-binding protein
MLDQTRTLQKERSETLLSLREIECRYQGNVAVHALSLDVSKGELCCLIGPSGCGKTTVLRAIAGLEDLSKGEIVFRKRRISSPRKSLQPEKRDIGMVFQEYALFPHLTVRENIGFSLGKLSAHARSNEIKHLMKITFLESSLLEHYPHELSGGQQQRVALARAVAARPSMLLMDEPFSNLDAQLRRDINLNLRKLLKQYGMSAILVTHDQEEGFAFSDHMGVLRAGRLLQWDSAYRLYHLPRNRFVAQFVGQGSFIRGEVADEQSVRTEIGSFPLGRHAEQKISQGDDVDVLMRPDDILYDKDSALRCLVQDKVFSGDRILYTLGLPGGETLQSLMPSHLDFEAGTSIGIATDLQHVIVFPRKS